MGMGSDYFIFKYYATWPFDPPYINGHEYVDLGLPSGLKWATCNVGSTKPEESGDYFAWGETATKTEYSLHTYFDMSDNGITFTKYSNDNKTVLEAENDAATVNWGGSWHIPTQSDWQELLNTENCTRSWTTQNGVNGCLFTSKKNGATLFFPAAGYQLSANNPILAGERSFYWSSVLSSYLDSVAWIAYMDNGEASLYAKEREFGRSVRPVSY